MGFNIHILSVRNRSTNLPGHAALAASFNPPMSQPEEPLVLYIRPLRQVFCSLSWSPSASSVPWFSSASAAWPSAPSSGAGRSIPCGRRSVLNAGSDLQPICLALNHPARLLTIRSFSQRTVYFLLPPIGLSRLCRLGFKMALLLPKPQKQHGEFAGHGGACPFGSAALDHLQSPALESRSARDCGQQAIGGLVEIVAHHLVSLPGDRQRYVSFSRLIALGRQAQIGPNIPVRTKTMPIFDRRREGKRRNRADAGRRHQMPARLLLLRPSANLLVQDRDLARHVRQRVQQGADRDGEAVLLVAGHSASLFERLGAIPLRYLDPEGPQQATDLAVKLALDPNQLIPRPP